MKKYLIANWKMHGRSTQLMSYISGLTAQAIPCGVQVVVCPPALYIASLKNHAGNHIALGAQDCAMSQEDGAFTGDLSAAMLADAGAQYVIVGHSERRKGHQETNITVAQKAAAVHAAGLVAVICVGETLAERHNGRTLDVLQHQLQESLAKSSNATSTIIAYEPVWAIGTGQAATPDDILAVHAFIKSQYPALSVLYGGSVNAQNAATLLNLPNVDGGLIGKASMDVADFTKIIASA